MTAYRDTAAAFERLIVVERESEVLRQRLFEVERVARNDAFVRRCLEERDELRRAVAILQTRLGEFDHARPRVIPPLTAWRRKTISVVVLLVALGAAIDRILL